VDSRWVRVARGAIAAGWATFVAALSHTIGGGAVPSVVAIVTTLVISVTICTLFAGGVMSTWRLAASIALSQALFHGVFSALGMPAAVAHAHAGLAAPSWAAASGHPHGGGGMWIAHAIAALVTIAAFLHAERAFRGLSGTARLFVTRLLAVIVPLAPSPRPQLERIDRRRATRDLSILFSTARHRGPPELTAA
jgi:hypothetical protein